jgi:UDP-N-acetylmuramyl tripeptide synthase
LIINKDDPSNQKFNELSNEKIYYGVLKNKFSKKEQNVAETNFCPKCGNRLEYKYINYGNIGNYFCNSCELKRGKLDYYSYSIKIKDDTYLFNFEINTKLQNKTKNFHVNDNKKFIFNYMGLYNIYNCTAAISFALEIGLDLNYIKTKIKNFEYKLGRMETIKFPNKDVILILSKNPVGLSEVLSTIAYETRDKSVMFILNDQPADGHDISWIWDADIEQIADKTTIKQFYCSGDRSEEVNLRLKYAGFPQEKIKLFKSFDKDKIKKNNNIENSIKYMLNNNLNKNYIIATFTAMPKARKILYDLLKKK